MSGGEQVSSEGTQRSERAGQVRELFDRAQWDYGHGLRSDALRNVLMAAELTALSRFGEGVARVERWRRFVADEVYRLSLGVREAGEPVAKVDGGTVPLGEVLAGLLAGLDGERGEVAIAVRGEVEFSSSQQLEVVVDGGRVTAPDLLIEGLATAVALAAENAEAFPPWPGGGERAGVRP